MKKKRLLIVLLFLNYSFILLAQNKIISGTVTNNKTGEKLEDISVTIDNIKNGTVTKHDGTYQIQVNQLSKTLIFTSVGFTRQEVDINGKNTIDVSLTPESNTLGDVVVIGYGTSRKRDLTGSTASISAKDLEQTPISRADQMIQGRASGVQVIQTNAAPGGNVSIRIRGTNSINSGNEPLFVVDGFPGAGDLNSINPSDIESIEILKDASSTAIYGSRGANGVVLITTKKGKAGVQAVNFETYYGTQNASKLYQMMNAPQFATYLDSVIAQGNRLANTTVNMPYSASQISAMGVGTNWEKAVLRQAPISSYQLSISGGTKDSRHSLSMNYFDQEGIVINSSFKRGTMRFNFDKSISSKIKMGLTSQLAFSNQNDALINTNGGSAGGVLYDALRYNPVLPVYDSTGAYTYTSGPAPQIALVGNPVAYANSTTNKNNKYRGLINAFIEYEFLKGLKFRLMAGADVLYGTTDFYTPSYLYLSTQNTTSGNAIKSSASNFNYLNEYTLNYDKKINSNNVISALAGMSWQKFIGDNLSAAANGFFTNDLGTNNLSIGATSLVPTSYHSENQLSSFFGRVNYRLYEKYLFTATMRADGSSRFGVNNKWGYFPSGAFAWRMIDEDFIKNINVFSDLKLRIGYGVTGNQEIGNYQSIPQYTSNNNNSYTLNNTRVVGVSIANIANPNLQWEQTSSADLGLDFGIFNNRLSGSIDIYNKKTTNLLFRKYIPATSGFTSELINAGSVGNKGIDIGLNFTAIENKDFGWKILGNISSNQNKILDLNGSNNLLAGNSSGSIFPGGGQPTSILQVGKPIGSFYGYQFMGIWQNQAQINTSGQKSPIVHPGDPIYADQNNDSIINGTDRVIIGHALPKFIYGLTNTFRYKKFGLMVFLQGVQGDNILNENLYEIQNGSASENKLASVANSWSGDGTSNTQARVSSILRRGTGITSDVIENGSYMRLKTVSLSYTLNFKMSKVIKSMLFYVTGQNLVTWTKYSGFDPEVNSYGNNSSSNNLSLNTDYGSYPSSKTILIGLKLGL